MKHSHKLSLGIASLLMIGQGVLTPLKAKGELPPNPYNVGDYYNAASYFRCSVGVPNHDRFCPGGIVRKGGGKASIVVKYPNDYEVQYDFKNNDVTSSFSNDLTWGKQEDLWYIGIENELYIIIPDAAIDGG